MRAREYEALRIVRECQPISRGDLAKQMGCAPRTAGQYLWLLKSAGAVQASGVGRFTKWVAL